MATIELRPASASDLPALLELHRAAEVFDGIPRVMSLEELEEELDDDHVRLDTDVRVALIDGALAGYTYTYHLPSEVLQERCYAFGQVLPGARGRGVGRELLAWAIERGTEQLRSSGSDLPKYLRVDADEQIEAPHRLYARMGFTPVRWMEVLLRPLTDLPVEQTLRGASIVDWPDDRDEDIRVEKNQAFLDHWGSTPTSPHHWEQLVRGFGARADLSCIAVDDATGEVVGHCMAHRYEIDDELLGRREGWVQSVGTLAAWRGRGIASAMIVRSLHHFAAADLTHAAIEVDADNPSGAARLYRSLGFTPSRRTVVHEIGVQ